MDALAGEYLEYQHTPWHEHLLDVRQAPVDAFWHHLSKMTSGNGNFLYPFLSKVMKALLCLPHGNVECERIFSKVQLIKTATKNRMGLELLNALLTFKFNKPFNDCYELLPTRKLISNACKALSYLDN